jgi:hypothetical protein
MKPGCCEHCGYDLANLPGGICPECGQARMPGVSAERWGRAIRRGMVGWGVAGVVLAGWATLLALGVGPEAGGAWVSRVVRNGAVPGVLLAMCGVIWLTACLRGVERRQRGEAEVLVVEWLPWMQAGATAAYAVLVLV